MIEKTDTKETYILSRTKNNYIFSHCTLRDGVIWSFHTKDYDNEECHIDDYLTALEEFIQAVKKEIK
jgi:hypothetical protein